MGVGPRFPTAQIRKNYEAAIVVSKAWLRTELLPIRFHLHPALLTPRFELPDFME